MAPAVHAQAAIRWRLASSFPKALDTIFSAAEVFANQVKAMSGGKFEISVHAAGELMPAFGVVDGVQQGSVEMAHTAPYYFFGKDECFAPRLRHSLRPEQPPDDCLDVRGQRLEADARVLRQVQHDQLPRRQHRRPDGRLVSQGNQVAQGRQGHEDAHRRLRRQGARAHRRRAAEHPRRRDLPALEKGTIDAAEWVGPYDDQKLGFNKVAPYYYYPGWWEGGPQLDFFINQKALDALSAENKAIVESAAAHAHVVMQARYDALNPAALKQLVGAGTKLRPFPQDVMAAAYKEAMGLYEELSAKNPEWAKIYADYSKFRADQNLWFRFTEATFDRFMQAQKL